jgi:deferrochelatase/peroxidase EfeB
VQDLDMQIDFSNVQAPVVHVYRLPLSRHLLFRLGGGGVEGARAFLRDLTPDVTMADVQLGPTSDDLVNVGITYNGLVALGLDQALLDTFDFTYQQGPRALPLGDIPGSSSDPATWWGGQFPTDDVHSIVHIYARSEDHLDATTAKVRGYARRAAIEELAPRRDGTVLDGRSLGGGKLHFGYTDGISHPDICWDDTPETQSQVNFRKFLLGYATPQYSSAPRTGPAADLVRDSSYAAFRWIYQDVAAFNRFLKTEAPALFPRLDPADAEELLAAKLMGRWRDGTPLVLSPDRPDPTMSRRNDFSYATADPDGHRCPFSAHIRVVDPRDSTLDPVAAASGVPRVLRRGMAYGPELTSAQDDGVDRGLIGIFFCVDLRLQIYTLTSWIKQNDFSPVYAANRRVQDALVANRAVPGTDRSFTIPAQDRGVTVATLPDFVQTKGTAFLLLPSKSMLQKLTAES